MSLVEKLWKKTKMLGKEIKEANVVENIGKIVEDVKGNQQPQDVVKSTLNERKVSRVLNHFEKLGISESEIDKLSQEQIAVIADDLFERNDEWGYNNYENFLLEKQKVATWGDYDIYTSKVAMGEYNAYYRKVGENNLVIQDFLFVTEKNGHIVGANWIKEGLDKNNIDFGNLESIIFVFDKDTTEKDNIKNVCIINPLINPDRYSAKVSMLTKNGKIVDLYVVKSNNAENHYQYSTLYLAINDKIIKNSLEKISRNYAILPTGEMKAVNNWQLDALNAELKGTSKVIEPPKNVNSKYKASFDADKNYGDIKLYAQEKDDEFVFDDDRSLIENNWIWKKMSVSPKTKETTLLLTRFEKVRKEEIINSKGEIESVHFYDKNGKELANDYKFDRNEIKYESSRDPEHIGHCTF